LQLRAELADVFTSGDYHALEVSGPHRDHVVAFARRHGKDACIVAVMRHFAGFTDGGRDWPRSAAFEGALDLRGFAPEGMQGAEELPLRALFPEMPVAVLKAQWLGAETPARKRVSA
jgi:(1->4)-alpha-D-glucan 1-alpha-D-glucosylmutase